MALSHDNLDSCDCRKPQGAAATVGAFGMGNSPFDACVYNSARGSLLRNSLVILTLAFVWLSCAKRRDVDISDASRNEVYSESAGESTRLCTRCYYAEGR